MESSEDQFLGREVPIFDFQKHDGGRGERTGTALEANTSPYAIFDFDPDGTAPRLFPCEGWETVKMVGTPSGGYHVYTCWDMSMPLTKNRYIKCGKASGYEIDLFVPVDEEKRSLVVLPPSLVKDKCGVIARYELIKDCDNYAMMSFQEAMSLLKANGVLFNFGDTKADEKEKPKIQKDDVIEMMEAETEESYDLPCTQRLFKTMVYGFRKEGLAIHNDSREIDKEVTLPVLFTGLNACESQEVTQKDIRLGKAWIRTNCHLTKNAKGHYQERLTRYESEKADKSYGVLLKMLKVHNPEYYETQILPILRRRSEQPQVFLESDYTVDQYIEEKTENSVDAHIKLLQKCLAVNTKGGYFARCWDPDINNTYIESWNAPELRQRLGITVLVKEGDGEETKTKKCNVAKLLQMKHVMDGFAKFRGIALLTDDDKVLQLFKPPEGKYDPNLIRVWLEFMRKRVYDDAPLMEELYSH